MYHALKHYIWYIDSRNTFGVYCSIDTSRIIRVCYWYLRDTQCCCITGTCIHMYNTQNNTGLKWHTWFQFWHRIWLDCCVGGRNRLDFSAEDRNWLDFSVGIGIHLVSVWGLKMTWLTVWIEINLAFVSGGIETDFVFVLVEIDLFFVRGSKWSWLLCAGRKWLALLVGIDWLGFVLMVEIELVFVRGPEITLF